MEVTGRAGRGATYDGTGNLLSTARARETPRKTSGYTEQEDTQPGGRRAPGGTTCLTGPKQGCHVVTDAGHRGFARGSERVVSDRDPARATPPVWSSRTTETKPGAGTGGYRELDLGQRGNLPGGRPHHLNVHRWRYRTSYRSRTARHYYPSGSKTPSLHDRGHATQGRPGLTKRVGSTSRDRLQRRTPHFLPVQPAATCCYHQQHQARPFTSTRTALNLPDARLPDDAGHLRCDVPPSRQGATEQTASNPDVGN